MLARAHVRHRLDSRTRISIPAKRGHSAYLNWVSGELANLPGVHQVTANPMTSSLVLTHSTDLETIGRFAEEQGLFLLVEEVPAGLRGQIRQRLDRLNDDIRQLTGGVIDLGDLVFLFLVGFVLRELARGNLALPSATTLAWYALTALSFPPALPQSGASDWAAGAEGD